MAARVNGAAPDIFVLCGSPHEGGASEKAAGELAAVLGERGANTTLWHLSAHPVAACRNCGGCAASGECVVADAWHVLSRHMDACDAFVLVAPVYFAGPPAHLKAALDRCQTYWTRRYRLHAPLPAARPARLVVLGEGGDPFGTDPLEAVCTSALNCANLRIDGRVDRFVGRDGAPKPAELAAIADAVLADAVQPGASSGDASPAVPTSQGARHVRPARESAPAGDGAPADLPESRAGAGFSGSAGAV